MVDGQMVWPWSWKLGHVSTSSRVHRQNRGDVFVDIRLPLRAYPLDHLDTTHLDSICEQPPLNNAL